MDQSTADAITRINEQMAARDRVMDQVKNDLAKIFLLLDEQHSKMTGIISWTDQAPRSRKGPGKMNPQIQSMLTSVGMIAATSISAWAVSKGFIAGSDQASFANDPVELSAASSSSPLAP